MKIKFYFGSIILFVSLFFFSQQHRENLLLKNYTVYNETCANRDKVSYCIHFITDNSNSQNRISAVLTTYFKIPAANILTSNLEHQHSNIVSSRNTDSDTVMVLSNTANYNSSVLLKNSPNHEVKKDFDNCNMAVLHAGAYMITILKGKVKTKCRQFVV